MNSAQRFDYLCNNAKAPAKSWTNKDLVIFHYFNKNGLKYTKLDLDNAISKLAIENKISYLDVLTYGTLNFNSIDKLNSILFKKNIPSTKVDAILMTLKDDIERAKLIIAAVTTKS
jgi:hypothetical protein